jgi:hypothetical protein
MHRSIRFALLAVSVALAACGGTGPVALPGPVLPVFDPANFVAGVNNPWFPLPVGLTWTYQKDTDEGLEEVVVTVLPQTKTILGVVCVVVHATETLDGELVEDTFDWYAQDADGNVWYLGEDSTEFENGMPVSTAGSWEAGVAGAQAGIIMLADPPIGLTYAQESAPGIAEDMATVLALDAAAVVPFGAFAPCLQTEDFTPLEPGISEWKYYAQGIGLILEEDEDGERTELVSVQ